jgi:glycine reductase
MPEVPKKIGCNRVVKGVAITNPTGDPGLPIEEERSLRRKVVLQALSALEKEVKTG